SVSAEQREARLGTGENPGLIAVAEIVAVLVAHPARAERGGLIRRARRTQHVVLGNDLPRADVAVVRQQPSEPRIVAQRGVEISFRELDTVARREPGRLAFRAHRLPD